MMAAAKPESYISGYSNVDYQYQVVRKDEVCDYRVPRWHFTSAMALRLEEKLLIFLESSYLFWEMEQ